MSGTKAVEGSHTPALHQREHAVYPEQDDVCRHLADDPLVEDVAFALWPLAEAKIGTVPVGQQRGAWRDVRPHESVDGFLCLVGHYGQADTTRAGVLVGPVEVGFRRFSSRPIDNFYRTNNDDPALRHAVAVIRAEWDFGLVDLDETIKRLLFAVNHRGPELVEQQPRGVQLDANLAGQLKGRDAVRVGGNQMRCPEPRGQRQLGPVEYRARSHRRLFAASQAPEGIGPRSEARVTAAPAGRANKASRQR